MNFIRPFFVICLSVFSFIGCDSIPGTKGSSPGECSDGADNDSDGDYDCNDPDCAGAPDCADVYAQVPA